MKLNNNALQELYDTLVNCTITISAYVDSPVDKAFRECDERLSESITFEEIKRLQSDNDILKRANDALLSANMEAISKNRKLEKDLDDAKKQLKYFTQSRDDWRSRAKHAEKEVEDLKKAKLHLEQSRLGWVNRANKSVEEFNLANKEITELKNRLDKANADRTERENEAIRELVDVRSQLNYCTHSRDNWRARAKYAEDEIEALKKDNKDLEKRLMETTETFRKANTDRTELQKDRDSYHGLYTELRKDYDKLFEENRKLKARTDCLRYEVEWYRKHYKEQSDKIKELKKQLEELTSQYQKLTIENKRLQNNVSSNYDQGQNDLWVALQNVNNSQPFEIATCFPDVTGLEDILNWDLEDFLDAYKKWQEEKEKERLDHMRDYLARFCEGRVCEGCPLESNEYKCGCGYSFKRRDQFDLRIIPDEELERYYKRAWHGDATAEKVKAACDAFAEGLKAGLASEVKEVPVSCDIPIKDLASWECTIEATVEINNDLLEKVCGVKPEFDISDKAIRNLTDSEKKAVQDFINSLNRKDDK